jgi:hypothetical protein
VSVAICISFCMLRSSAGSRNATKWAGGGTVTSGGFDWSVLVQTHEQWNEFRSWSWPSRHPDKLRLGIECE